MPFPEVPAAPKYQYMAPADHKAMLVGQLKQFEGVILRLHPVRVA